MPMRVNVESWVGLALLHSENPNRTSFRASEIRKRIAQEKSGRERPGIAVHIYQHNVANVPPNSGRYRLFYKLEDGTLRLFRPGDDYHPDRRGKTHPEMNELPNKYQYLLTWYGKVYSGKGSGKDPLLEMRGVGEDLWYGVDADRYVADLRVGWPAELQPATQEKAS